MNDVTQASDLLRGLSGRAVVGDRAYDSDAFLALIEQHAMEAVIPLRANRKQPRALDAETYACRNIVDRFFGRLKTFRRIATRYEKTAASYSSAVAFSASLVLLSGWVP